VICTGKERTMAKRQAKINKSQAIRDHLAKSPTATPSEIKQALAEKGITVGDSLISQIKYNPRQAKSLGRVAAIEGDMVSLKALLAAKAFAQQMGGVARAKSALLLLERLC
jgi:hypothetical protein